MLTAGTYARTTAAFGVFGARHPLASGKPAADSDVRSTRPPSPPPLRFIAPSRGENELCTILCSALPGLVGRWVGGRHRTQAGCDTTRARNKCA